MAVHPNSLANLRPAQKGEVRNPKGENGATKSWQREILLLRTLDELRQKALTTIARLVINRAR